MRDLTIELTEKQGEAIEYLNDNETDEVYFGGGAGGGKSFLGCLDILLKCEQYPGTRWFIGREEWEMCRATTQKTFFEVLSIYGYKKFIDFKYNGQTKTLTFKNKSEVVFGYLKYDPSDPDYDYLGSSEYTGGFIDEASQIALKGKNVLKSRFRYKIKEYNIKPKLLLTFNPSKGWLYVELYKPWKEGALPKNKKYVSALAIDNNFNSDTYIENLLNNDDPQLVQRLYYGNWDYDDDPRTLIDYDRLLEIFTRKESPLENNDYYLIVDVARKGKDTTTISLWKGWKIIWCEEYKQQDTAITEKIIFEMKEKYNIFSKNIVIDEVGVGGGIIDTLMSKGIRVTGFVANHTAQKNKDGVVENYGSLKDQCAFRLAKKVNDGAIAVYSEIKKDIKDRIITELSILKSDNKEDKKLKIESKEKQKEVLRCSPDWLDNFIMRCAVLKTKPKIVMRWS